MTTGLQNPSSSALSPAISALTNNMAASPKRGDKATGASGGQSFSQMLQQQQTAALAPPPSPVIPPPAMAAEAKAHGSGDQGASRLSERQAGARQMDAAQQASRDAQALADKSAQSRRDEAKASEGNKNGSGSGSSASSSESKPASKTHAASHHHHARSNLHADKAKDAQAKKAVKADEADPKTSAKKATEATEDPAATTTATPGAQPTDAAHANAPDAEGKAVAAHQPGAPADDPLAADPGAALAGKHGLANTHGLMGKGAKGGADLAATANAGKIDPKAGAEAASAKSADALAADTKAAPQADSKDASFAAALKSLGADPQAIAGQGEGHRPGQESNAAARIDGPSGAAGMFGAAATSQGTQQAAEAPAPQQIMFATPTSSPDFAQSLGISITSLAQNGVHEAQLHMNPAETGPISIQITVDGTAAQVDFQAANADTRNAIYAGMPELAAALNAAGLTLTGGGVSEHSRGNQSFQDQLDQRRNDGNGNGTGRRTASVGGVGSEGASPRMTAQISRPTQGGVDLYA